MAIRRKRESRDQRRFTRSSTKKGFVIRPPAHPWRIVGGVVAVIAVVALALVWGSYLKTRSDAFREAQERGEWTLEADSTLNRPVAVPNLRAVSIKPMGNVGDIIIAGDHGGVIMTLRTTDGTLCYRSNVGEMAGLTTESDAPTLTDDVARVSRRGLHTICAFAVTCFDAPDSATHTYLRGLELALLREYAEAGMNDILLFGLPAGTDGKDADTVAFLGDLQALLADLPSPPAVGVALSAACFTTEDHPIPTLPEAVTSSESDSSALPPVKIPDGKPPHYVGDVTPARLLTACEYLVLDLRSLTAAEIETALPHLPYAYTRYSLCLLVDKKSPAIAEEILSHGFERVLEMDP